jgi:type I restriction enzyme S subunit
MGSEWTVTTIADLAESINTGLDAIRRAPIVSHRTNLRCLRIQDISQRKPIENWGFTETTETDLRKYKLTKNEIIMARTCSTGICYLVEENLPAVFNNGLARIRLDTAKAFPKFIYHVFKSHDFKAFIDGISGGTSVQLNMKVGDMARYELPLPPLPEQRAIAHILGSLDDRIELNRRMNGTLEGMAQALFKSWFVDFDPVIDNALAAGNPIPEELADRAEVRRAALADGTANREAAKPFPAAFQQTEELGWIPEGWEAKRWGEMAKLQYGKTLKGYRDSIGGVPVFGTNGPIGFIEKALCESDGIVIGRKGAYRGVHYSCVPFYVIDTAFYLEPVISLSNNWAYYELLRFDINGMDSGSAIPSAIPGRSVSSGILGLRAE